MKKGFIRKARDAVISWGIGSGLTVMAHYLAQRSGLLIPKTPAILIWLAIAMGAFVGLLVFAYLHMIDRYGLRSRRWRWSGVALGGSLACAMFVGILLFSGEPAACGPYSVSLTLDGQRITLCCEPYKTNGKAVLDVERRDGRKWVSISLSRLDLPYAELDETIPFDCGVMLRPRSRDRLDLSAYSSLELILELGPSDTVGELGVGIADSCGAEVNYKMERYITSESGQGQRTVHASIRLGDFIRYVNVRKVHQIVIFTRAELIGPDGQVAFEVSEIGVSRGR